jgi:hypothetical protein
MYCQKIHRNLILQGYIKRYILYSGSGFCQGILIVPHNSKRLPQKYCYYRQVYRPGRNLSAELRFLDILLPRHHTDSFPRNGIPTHPEIMALSNQNATAQIGL